MNRFGLGTVQRILLYVIFFILHGICGMERQDTNTGTELQENLILLIIGRLIFVNEGLC